MGVVGGELELLAICMERRVPPYKAHGKARYEAQLCALDTRDQDG